MTRSGRTSPLVTRRQVLFSALGAASAAGLGACGGGSSTSSSSSSVGQVPKAGSDLGAVEHVVFLMQENRSFDHYFGTYPGVRGFDDRSPGALPRFRQPWPGGPSSELFPYHLAQAAQSICVGSYGVPDIEWITQHSAWDNGRLDAFLTTEARGDATLEQAPVVMGYLTRAELPFYFSLADAFTLCDSYHCSVLGPTMPNRLYSISGTIDPQGRHGGPVVDTPAPAEGSAAFGSCDWITMPEVLEDHGISWKVYEEAGTASGSALRGAPATSFNALSFFKQHVRDPNSALYQRAFLPTWPAEFNADVQSGQLPTVSWVLPPLTYSEHPSTDPLAGQWFISQVLSALMTNRQLWSRTVVFLTYDENGGFFDHVSPPTSPAGTADEMVTTKARTGQAGDFDQPIGLGFRVPTLVVSPWSRGGWINSETFDHTSMLRFLEARFDVRAPNISAWRRETVGDLTSTLSFRAADDSPVSLPSTSFEFAQGCPTPQNLGPFFGPPEAVSVPNAPQLPTQEPGTARRRPT